jgi:protein-tyrosine phosphatase
VTATSAPFLVLTVCTGNICRSPLAERVLATGFAALAERAGPRWRPAQGIRFRSAGTHALAGEAMTAETQQLALAAGTDPSGHVARQLGAADIASAGLVLALTRAHRRDVVSLVPQSSRITFALPEFARLLDALADGATLPQFDPSDPATAMPAIVAAVGTQRGLVPPPDDPAIDDVIDPYGRSAEVYARAAGQITDASATILSALDRILGGRG